LRAEAIAAQERLRDSERYLSIVLLTDGENTAGPDLASFRSTLANGAPARVFPILFGESNSAEMDRLASFTGGRSFDGRKAALAQVFKEIRGYQ
jgi:Ca-activated chloride channel family protein